MKKSVKNSGIVMSMRREKNYDKYAIVIGSALSLTLTLIILRKFIFKPGLVESGDVYFPYKLDDQPQYVWSTFLSSSLIPYHHVIFSWLTPLMEIFASINLITASIETLQRLLWGLLFTLIGLVMFLVVFNHTRRIFTRPISCYAASILASMIYTFNPYVVGIIQWWPNLLSYALLPLLFHLVPAAVNNSSWRGTLKIGLAAALLLALNFCSPGAALNTILFIIFLIIVQLIFKVRTGFKGHFLRCSVLLIEIIGLALLLNSYSILPFLQLREEFTWGGQNIPLQVQGLQGAGGANITMLDAFRLWKWTVDEPFSLYPRALLTLIVPMASLVALILFNIKSLFPKHFSSIRKVDRNTMVAITLLIITALFLAKGINDPFGDFYVWLVFSTPFSWLFQHSEIWIRYLCLGYAFLCSFLLAQLIDNLPSIPRKKYSITFFKMKRRLPPLIAQSISYSWKAKTAICFLTIIIFSVSARFKLVHSYPSGMFLGTAGGYLRPSVLPEPYYRVNDWLSTNSEEFRTIWLPISGELTWMRPSGAPPHPIGEWASSMPIVTPNHPSQRDFMTFAYNHLGDYETFADLLGIFSVRYLVYHNDTMGDAVIYDILKGNPILKQVYTDDILYVFENKYFQPYLRALDKTVFCVSNPNVLNIFSTISTFDTSNVAMIFAEQLPELGMNAIKYLTDNDILLFYSKSFTDLLFSCIGEEHIYSPSNYLGENTRWRAENRRDLMNNEFDYEEGFVYSPFEKLTFSFEIVAKETTEYEIWARVYGAQKLTISLGEYNQTVKASPLDPKGFSWVKLGEPMLSEGSHKITIVNEEGWGNLNLIAALPTEKMREVEDTVLHHINGSDVRIVNIFNRVPQTVFVPRESGYIFALRVDRGSVDGNIMMEVDGEEYPSSYDIGYDESDWLYTPPISLTYGQHNITFSPQHSFKIRNFAVLSASQHESSMTLDDVFKGETIQPIITYERSEAEVCTVSVETTTSFILAFSETYHSLWRAYTDDLEYEKMPLYSQINGFLINKTGSFTIKIEFLPGRTHYFGEVISSLTLLSMIAGYIFFEDKLRKNVFLFKTLTKAKKWLSRWLYEGAVDK